MPEKKGTPPRNIPKPTTPQKKGYTPPPSPKPKPQPPKK